MDILAGMLALVWVLSYYLFVPISITIFFLIMLVYKFVKFKKIDKNSSYYQNLKKSVLKIAIITCICAVITIDLYITNLIFEQPMFYM